MVLLPLAFPAMETASFFSTTLVENRPDVDLVSLYVPQNPFHALANNVVPAVVLFSVVLGVALMGVPGKERLLESLSVLEDALARANRFLVRLTPLGVFAIAAHFTGTLDVGQLARFRLYLVAFGAMALFLTLYVLPVLVACVTPIPALRVLAVDEGRPDHGVRDRGPVRRPAHPDRPLQGSPGGGGGDRRGGWRPARGDRPGVLQLSAAPRSSSP